MEASPENSAAGRLLFDIVYPLPDDAAPAVRGRFPACRERACRWGDTAGASLWQWPLPPLGVGSIAQNRALAGATPCARPFGRRRVQERPHGRAPTNRVILRWAWGPSLKIGPLWGDPQHNRPKAACRDAVAPGPTRRPPAGRPRGGAPTNHVIL